MPPANPHPTHASGASESPRRLSIAALVGVLLVTALAYESSLSNGFTNWDDVGYVTRNPNIADLSSSPPALSTIDAQSQSGHPGSPHYGDQFDQWKTGGYNKIRLKQD